MPDVHGGSGLVLVISVVPVSPVPIVAVIMRGVVSVVSLRWMGEFSIGESEVPVVSAERRVVPVVHAWKSGLAQTQAQGSDYCRPSCRLRRGGGRYAGRICLGVVRSSRPLWHHVNWFLRFLREDCCLCVHVGVHA